MRSKEISRFHDLDFFIIPTMKYLWNITSAVGKKSVHFTFIILYYVLYSYS